MRHFLLFFILYSVINLKIIIGQEYRQISGRVLTGDSNESLASATVSIAGNKIATITNLDGYFVLKIPNEILPDTLKVSFLGFYTYECVIDSNNFVEPEIVLIPRTFLVTEIVIYPTTAEELLIQAYKNVGSNYPNKAMRLKAFYRETVLENNSFISFVEAVFGIYKGSYSEKKDKDRIKIIKGRKKHDVKNSKLWDYIYFVDGAYEMLYADVIKYPNNFISVPQSDINFLRPQLFKYYSYKLLDSETLGQEDLYIIEFFPKKKRALFYGTIYLDKSTLAVKRLVYAVHPEKINKTLLIPFDVKSELNAENINIETIDYFCMINYKQFEGKWVFDNAKMVYKFLLYSPNDDIFSIITNSVDFVITDIETKNVEKIKLRDALHIRKELSQQFGEFDPEFWENYNYIEIDK